MAKKYIPDTYDHYWHVEKKLPTFVDDQTEEEFIADEKLFKIRERSMRLYGRPDIPPRRAQIKCLAQINWKKRQKNKKG